MFTNVNQIFSTRHCILMLLLLVVFYQVNQIFAPQHSLFVYLCLILFLWGLADVYISLYIFLHFYMCLCVFACFLSVFVCIFKFLHVKLIDYMRNHVLAVIKCVQRLLKAQPWKSLIWEPECHSGFRFRLSCLELPG